MGKKKPGKVSLAKIAPQDLLDAILSRIGLDDHHPDNEGKEWTYILTNELHEQKNAKLVDLELLRTEDAVRETISALHKAQVPSWLTPGQTTYAHEFLHIEDNSDEGVWIEAKVRLFGLTILNDNGTIKFFKEAKP